MCVVDNTKQILYLTDCINEKDIPLVKSLGNIKTNVKLLIMRESYENLGLQNIFSEIILVESFSDILSYTNSIEFAQIVTPCDYLAVLLLQSGKQVIYICQHLITVFDGEPLERLLMENYLIREANEVVYSSPEEKVKASRKYVVGKPNRKSLKKNLIIFGAGEYGECFYKRFCNEYDIMAFADNNPGLKGQTKNELPIIRGEEILNYDLNDTDIVVCIMEYQRVVTQLHELGIHEFYLMNGGFLFFNSSDGDMSPIELNEYPYYYKNYEGEKNILYTQNAACIRTHKTAFVMKEYGYHVNLLYTLSQPLDANMGFSEVYDNLWGFTSLEGIYDFIQNSEFDIVHCSNEPDYLANIALLTDKPVVADVHDMMSLRGKISENNRAFEFRANSCSDGCMYTSAGVAGIAREKFGLDNESVFMLENLVIDQVEITEPYDKLSGKDGKVHCVYEGGVEGAIEHHRYFEDIWLNLVKSGDIHVHFYSQSNKSYCEKLESLHPNIHYEGNMGSYALVQEMTKYDCGLLIFNVTDRNRDFLETASPNKLSEYLNARIPVITYGINSYEKYIKEERIGIVLEPAGNIDEQLREVMNITIPGDFLSSHKKTVRSLAKDISDFYEKIKAQPRKTHR